MIAIPARAHNVAWIGRAPTTRPTVQSLLNGDTLDGAIGGLDVGDDLKPRVSRIPRLAPRPEAFNNRRVNLDPARARHDDPLTSAAFNRVRLAPSSAALKPNSAICDAGQVLERRVETSPNPQLAGVEWPVLEVVGAREGPRLSLLAGIHGCEYPAIAAVRRFMAAVDSARLSGSITAVPVVSPTSFAARSAFVVPEDGRNLNRSFPGNPGGSFTEALADHVFRAFIEPADLLIDLHGGDLFEALEPFVIYDASPCEQAAGRLARAYGLRYVIRNQASALAATTSGAAAAAAIPAIIAEVGGCGLLVEDDVQRHLRGLRGALTAAGMLDDQPAIEPGEQVLIGTFSWLRCERAGWWQSEVEVGDHVAGGQRLGAILDLFGDEQQTVTAPHEGVVMFLTTSPAVADDGLLLAVGGE